MATTTLPQPQTVAHRGRWIAGAIAVVVVAISAALIFNWLSREWR